MNPNVKRFLPLILAAAAVIPMGVLACGLVLCLAVFGGSDDYAPVGMQGGMDPYGQYESYAQPGYAQQGYTQQDAAAAAAWLQALGGAAQTGGGDNFWSAGGAMGNTSADGGTGYVHIPSSTGGSGTTVSYGY